MDLLGDFLRHNSMMNMSLLDACEPLGSAQLDTGVEGTYGTVAATLVHMCNSQDAYAARFFGDERPDPLERDPFPGIERLRERFAGSNARLEKAAALADDGREVQVTGDDPVGTWRMPGALLLLQAVNHATEHRSQISTILTQLGIEPPAMDGWTYFFDAGYMIDVAGSSE